MKRSTIGLIFALLGAPLVAEAQQAGKTARIGILCAVQCAGTPGDDALREGLAALDWVEGRNLTVAQRGAGGQLDRPPALAAELVGLKPDLIIADAPQPNRAARDATSTIPIVMIGVADPVRMGLAQSLARPGGNVTGLATLVPGGFIAKQLELLKEAVPRATSDGSPFRLPREGDTGLRAKRRNS
jgi:putative ABC transport system substrate-binding protein